MRIIFFDYKGTLDRLENPVTFIRYVKACGDYTILHTGSVLSDIEKAFPNLLETFDLICGKSGRSYPDIVTLIMEDNPDKPVTEVLFVDDETWMAYCVEDWNGVHECGVKWTFVPANDIKGVVKQ